MNDPDQFVDVDFDKQPEFVFGDMGAKLFSACAAYEDVEETWTDAQCREAVEWMDSENTGLEWLVTRIYDQGREGACVANACGQANEIQQANQFGIENVVHLSAMSLYQLIGRSASSGAFVDDGVETMAEAGILPLDTPENRERFEHVMPNTGFRTPRPAGCESTMKLFTGAEFHPIRTLQGILTAGAKRHPVIVGRDGHSICYPRLGWDKNWVFDYVNSWNERWGFALGNMKGGFGRDTISRVKKSARYAFALRSVNHPLLGAA